MLKHFNADGGAGAAIKQESHAANLYCALGTLELLGDLNKVPPA